MTLRYLPARPMSRIAPSGCSNAVSSSLPLYPVLQGLALAPTGIVFFSTDRYESQIHRPKSSQIRFARPEFVLGKEGAADGPSHFQLGSVRLQQLWVVALRIGSNARVCGRLVDSRGCRGTAGADVRAGASQHVCRGCLSRHLARKSHRASASRRPEHACSHSSCTVE